MITDKTILQNRFTWKSRSSADLEMNIISDGGCFLNMMPRTKQPQMALRFWTPKTIRFKPSPINRPLPKHNQLPCQHIRCAPSSFLSPLPSSSPQPCTLDASVSATPVIPLILNRLASATEENPQSGRLLGACSAETPLIGSTWR